MRYLFAALLFTIVGALGIGALCDNAEAQIQSAITVSSCGSQSYTAGQPNPATQTTGGVLCTGSGGSGGGTVVYGPVAVGSAQTQPPVMGGGTANGVGTGTTEIFTVKPASTASVNTDTALVIDSPPDGTLVTAISSSIPLGTNNIGTVGNTQASTTSGQYGPLVQCASTTSAPSYTTAQTDPLSCDTSGNLRVSLLNTPTITTSDPCFGSAKSYADFESTSSGGSIITASSGLKAYICSISIVSSAIANVSIVEGTGSSVCTGGTTAGDYLNTGTTAANGAYFLAGGGIQAGDGEGTIFANATADYNTCVVFSTTNTPQVNVHVAYVQHT